MEKIIIDVAKLTPYAFAGLVAGCLTDRKIDRNITAEVRGEKRGEIIITVWYGVSNYTWFVNKETKEITSSGPFGTRPLSNSVVEMLFDKHSSNEKLANLLWGDDASKQADSAA